MTPQPHPCPECGKVPRQEDYTDRDRPTVFWRACPTIHCWIGPVKPTPAEALEAWNRVVGAVIRESRTTEPPNNPVGD